MYHVFQCPVCTLHFDHIFIWKSPIFSSVQSLSPVWLFVTPWTTAYQASLSSTVFQSLLKLVSIEWCHQAISSQSPPSPTLNLSQHQGLFQCVSSFIRWPKYQSFSFSIIPSCEYSGLISFRIDWLDLLAVTLLTNHCFLLQLPEELTAASSRALGGSALQTELLLGFSNCNLRFYFLKYACFSTSKNLLLFFSLSCFLLPCGFII